MTFSGVASNFAGIPLALAFTYTLSTTGLVTVLLKNLGLDIYGGDFTIFSKLGIELVYLYFQFPLMVLIIAPAIDGLKPEWREACREHGRDRPPVLAAGRPADPRPDPPRQHDPAVRQRVRRPGDGLSRLTAGQIPLVPLAIGNQISGDVLHNVGLGYAMAMGMVVVMAISIIGLHLAPATIRALAAMSGSSPSIGARAPGALEIDPGRSTVDVEPRPAPARFAVGVDRLPPRHGLLHRAADRDAARSRCAPSRLRGLLDFVRRRAVPRAA
ncbi:MAG: hypothetical protein WKF78_09950 [Candidatus Limnocylindrales bacterium]